MPALTPLASASSPILQQPFSPVGAHAMNEPLRRPGRARPPRPPPPAPRSPPRRSRARASTSAVCSPSAGPGRVGSAGVRLHLHGVAQQPHRLLGAGLIDLHHHLARAHELGVERLVEVQHRLQAAVVPRRELRHSLARALEEDALHLGMGVGARAGRTAARSGPRGPRRDTTPARTSARARPSVTQPSLAGVGPVADVARPPARARRAAGALPSAKWRAATIASQESEPSAIETSTNWPSPERSRSRSAARIPNAAISAPPPRSAIWPAAWIGRAVVLAGEARAARPGRGSSCRGPSGRGRARPGRSR